MRKWFNQFSEWLVSFKIEAYLHILVTMLIAMFVARICVMTGADRLLAGWIGTFVGILCGLFKESWDNKSGEEFEAGDMAANAIGAFLFVLMWM